MSDTIPSLDRSDLNVGGRSNRNKSLVIGLFALLFLIIVGVAGVLTFLNFATVEKEIQVETNHDEGAKTSTISDSNNYFAALRKEKDRTDKFEADRIKRLEFQKLERERKNRERLEKERLAMLAEQQRLLAAQNNKPNAKPVVIIKEQPAPVVGSRQSGNVERAKTPAELSFERKKRSGVMLNLNSAGAAPVAPKNFDNSFNGSNFSAGTASLGEVGASDFLLSHGTSIPCALYTQIISDYEGFVTCRTTQDVYSENGAALLIERGSLISGNQKVAMELGKARIFTTWSDIKTPQGVSIRIDSLGTGALGASGLPAWVDNHWAERFGSAILLSFLDDALAAIASSQEDKDVQFDNSTRNTSDIASKALDSSINIKPTGYAKLGQRINIMLVRDIDMSSVYQFGGSY